MASRKKDTLSPTPRTTGHRQLRVGEEVRHILSNLLLRADFPAPGLPVPVTVTQVKMSPDLQNATIYFMPLGGQLQEETANYLQNIAGYIRYQLGKDLHLKYTPALRFHLDRSFDNAQRIEELLNK